MYEQMLLQHAFMQTDALDPYFIHVHDVIMGFAMWFSFLTSALIGSALLYIPGFLLLKAARMDTARALASAPLISCALLFVTAEAFVLMHIPLSAVTLCFYSFIWVPVIMICVYAYKRIIKKTSGNTNQTSAKARTLCPGLKLSPLPPTTYLTYLFMGLLGGLIFFILPISSPENIAQGWDIVSHLNFTQTMIGEGTYNAFLPSFYEHAFDAINPSSYGTKFYPAGWNILCAAITQLAQTNTVIAANALNFIFTSVVYPWAIMTFIAQVYPRYPRTVYVGAFLPALTCVFPWILLVYGPLFPFVAALCITPAIFWIFMTLTRSKTTARDRMYLIPVFICGAITLIMLHPSSFFVCVLILTPWCIARIKNTSRNLHIGAKRISALLLSIVFLWAVVAGWIGLYCLIVGKVALNYWWSAYSSIPNALIQTVLFEFVGTTTMGNWFVAPQPVLFFVFIIGVWQAFKHARGRFLAVSYLYLICVCIIVICSDLPIKGVLSSFWYTDPYRIAALISLVSLPLVAHGLDALCVFAQEQLSPMVRTICSRINMRNCRLMGRVKRLCYASSRTTSGYALSTAFVVVFFLVANTLIPFPQFKGKNPHEWPEVVQSGGVINNIKVVAAGYHDTRFLDPQKYEFLKRAQKITQQDVVLNNPFDGSVLAYGMTSMQTFWRYPYVLNEFEKPSFARVRIELDEISYNDKVRDAVKKFGAKYVLSLGKSRCEDASLMGKYSPQAFSGIDRITPDTKGFTLVLQQDDMALYKIDAI